MSPSLKAALLSLFVFPGSGHFFLKHYKVGMVFLISALGCLLFLMMNIAPKVFEIVEQVQRGELQADALSSSDILTRFSSAESISTLFIIIWLAAIIHAYYLGRK